METCGLSAERHLGRNVRSKSKNHYLINEDGDPGACEIVVAMEERLSVHGGRADELLMTKKWKIIDVIKNCVNLVRHKTKRF
jgi:hypothetical protein